MIPEPCKGCGSKRYCELTGLHWCQVHNAPCDTLEAFGYIRRDEWGSLECKHRQPILYEIKVVSNER